MVLGSFTGDEDGSLRRIAMIPLFGRTHLWFVSDEELPSSCSAPKKDAPVQASQELLLKEQSQ